MAIRRLFLVAVLGLSAVTSSACFGRTCACPALFLPDGGQLSTPVGFPGQTERVQVPVPSRIVANHLESPTGVEVAVADPNGLPVQANVDPLPPQGLGPLSFSFVPLLPGQYHVTVRFNPGFGITQADVQIAADRTDAGVVARAMPVECARFEPSGGVDFCLDARADQLVTLVSGQAVSRVDAWDFARAPSLSGVWVVADGGADHNWVRLYALDGGALGLTFEQELPWSSMVCPTCGAIGAGPQHAILKARENRLLLVDLPQLLELAFDGGELAVNDLGPGPNLPPVVFAQWGPFGSVAGWTGGMIGISGGAACVLPWDGGICAPLGSNALGADDELLWSYEPSTGLLSAFGLPLDGGPAIAVRLPVAPPVPAATRPEREFDHFYWNVGSDTAVARFDGSELSIEAFALPLEGAAHSGVDPSRLWRWDPDDGGTIRYIDR